MGHRLSEWCGHGPVLEQDIALINIALDLVGQAKSFLEYAAEVEGEGRDADDLAYKRIERNFRNVLLAEQPNEDFAFTIVRQFLFDAFQQPFYQRLTGSKDAQIAAIAAKSLKEVNYHLRFSSEWTIRLGDGTDVSHQKMQTALDELWMFTGELFEMTETDKVLIEKGIAVNLNEIKTIWDKKVDAILTEATLQRPTDGWMQSGGKKGVHTENLGYILAEMQYLPRAYPDAKW
jgi:ring-1,2-phenylacetyl-CoA epoxidase subunit PaaC